MKRHPGIRSILAASATAVGLSSCAVKDGRLDFTWWQDAAAPVMEDDVIIEAGGGGYYRSTPAPARIPQESIPKEEPEKQVETTEQVVAQQQPATQTPPNSTPTAKPAVAQTIPGVHVVQPGDTLSAIARRYGTTVNALVTTNGMANANVPLRISQQLKLPSAGAQPTTPAAAPQKPKAEPKPAASVPTAAGTTYKVQAGDTLYRISRQYSVNPKDLMQANGLTPETANTIRVGTILRIPASQ
ncbi:MAG: LysM peptidoglycan-binding domain-containing protein [Akkermansia sp.]|nr:LysM peptidoglycan-binding domain-containing protein [Akkermansia sp.]